MLTGLEEAVTALSPYGGAGAARAILTTDTCTKEAAVHADGFSVGGMAKGSGMIHPNLATMLAVVTTDYPLEPGEPLEYLQAAVAESFNSISVDGECSTNDAVVLLSSAKGSRGDDGAFAEALHTVCAELARQIVADGEGRRWSQRSTSAARPPTTRRKPLHAGSRRRRSSRPRSSARTRTGDAFSPRRARRRSTAATHTSTRTP